MKCTYAVGWFIDRSETEKLAELQTRIERAVAALRADTRHAAAARLEELAKWLDSHQARTVYLPLPDVETEEIEVVGGMPPAFTPGPQHERGE